MKIREPAVAGRFYPGSASEIKELVENIFRREKSQIATKLAKEELIGGVVPHAGYIFSAYQALHFFEIAKQSGKRYQTVFIIHPNHTGYGDGVAFDEHQAWQTPLGTTKIDSDFVEIMNFPRSAEAHQYEHSGEVMLPLLQLWLNYEFEIVPICIKHQNTENAQKIARAIFEANQTLKKEILLIASSDFSHFLPPKTGAKLDDMVVEQILRLDSEKVFQTVTQNNISVCGFCPIMTLIEYAKKVAQKPKMQVLKRGHSGEIVPSNEVVDYVSMLCYNEE